MNHIPQTNKVSSTAIVKSLLTYSIPCHLGVILHCLLSCFLEKQEKQSEKKKNVVPATVISLHIHVFIIILKLVILGISKRRVSNYPSTEVSIALGAKSDADMMIFRKYSPF